MYPILCLNSALSFRGFNPITRAVPPEGRSAPTRPLIRVVFPAPFGPTRPNTSPLPTERSAPPNASTRPYLLVNPETSMAFTLCPPSLRDPAGRCRPLLQWAPLRWGRLPYGREEHLAPSLGEKHP